MRTALTLAMAVHAAPYLEKVSAFNPAQSRVSIREIPNPTLASLDYAAYDRSLLRWQESPALKPKLPPAHQQSLQWNGLLTQLQFQGPAPTGQPMPWQALKKRLYEQFKDESLAQVLSPISATKWVDSTPHQAYQQVANLWFLPQGQIWVEVELAPWFKGFPQVRDLDGDGIREFRAQISEQAWANPSRSTQSQWIRDVYQGQKLSAEAARQWAQVLASYWYPTLNTDLLPISGQWPETDTEKEILQTLGKTKAKQPFAVLRGNPRGKVLYQVFQSPGLTVLEDQSSAQATGPKALDTTTPPQFAGQTDQWNAENAGWRDVQGQQTLQTAQAALRTWLKSVPADQQAIQSTNGALHFRRELDYLLADSINAQAPGANPLPKLLALKDKLAKQGVQLLIAPIPPKTEIYPEDVPGMPTELAQGASIARAGRVFMAQMQAAGLDVLDLTPAFQSAKGDDQNQSERLFQRRDTHWGARGFAVAAEALIGRIQAYSWYNSLQPQPGRLRMEPTTTIRLGDLVEQLPEAQQTGLGPDTLLANQFWSGDALHTPIKGAPILLMGDSFTGVFETIDCKSAGLASHLAYGLGLPIDLVTSWGGGPAVPERLFKTRKKELAEQTRLVVYVLTARDFWKAPSGWQ